MSATLDLPFSIGQTLWLPRTSSQQVRVSCPVCAGQRRVSLMLGAGDVVSVECDACGLGFDGARGFIEEWVYEPAAEPFTIAAVAGFSRDRWTVQDAAGGAVEYADLRATEAEALAVSTARCAEQHERNMQSRQRKKANAQRLTWTVRYHRERIRDLEREIAWHRARVTA